MLAKIASMNGKAEAMVIVLIAEMNSKKSESSTWSKICLMTQDSDAKSVHKFLLTKDVISTGEIAIS